MSNGDGDRGQVVGLADDHPPRRAPNGLLLVTVGLVAGLVIGVLVGRSDPDSLATTTTGLPTAGGTTTTTTITTTTTSAVPAGSLGATPTIGLAPISFVDGAAVYDLRLVDGERFRLSLPESLVGAMTLTQPPEPASVVIEGPTATITISFDHCPDQDGMSENRLGSTVAMTDDLVRVCRPDELLAMVISPAVPLDQADADAFDLRPIQLGSRYRNVLVSQWQALASCSNCASWGPMVYPEDNVVVNRTGATAVTAVKLDTLEEAWTVDTGGFDTYLHGGPDLVYLEVTGGPFLSLDPATGSDEWRIERDPDERSTGLSGHGGAAWFLRSSFSIEGDDRPPLLRRIDPGTGEVLWTASGRQGTDWQWASPAVLDDVVTLMDVSNEPLIPVDPIGGAMQAFDLATGARAWITDLESPTEAFDVGLVIVLEFEDGKALIARTIDGDIVRVDTGTGEILWRLSIPQGRFGGTEFDPNGTLAIDITTPAGRILVDPTTGETIDVVAP